MNGPGYATTADTATGIRLMMRDSVITSLGRIAKAWNNIILMEKSHFRKPMKNLLIATLLLATLSGCALLRSQVAVLHQLPEDFSGTTYVMIPFKEQEGTSCT